MAAKKKSAPANAQPKPKPKSPQSATAAERRSTTNAAKRAKLDVSASRVGKTGGLEFGRGDTTPGQIASSKASRARAARLGTVVGKTESLGSGRPGPDNVTISTTKFYTRGGTGKGTTGKPMTLQTVEASRKKPSKDKWVLAFGGANTRRRDIVGLGSDVAQRNRTEWPASQFKTTPSKSKGKKTTRKMK